MDFHYDQMAAQPDYDQLLDDCSWMDLEPHAKKLRVKALTPPKQRGLMDIGMQALRYHVLLYCDHSTLLRVNWVNRALRAVCNMPEFVHEWQDAAWFLRVRGCRCDRNLFMLDLGAFIDFGWDCNGIDNVRKAEIALRAVGRSPALYTNALYRATQRLPYLDPSVQWKCFSAGILDTWFENILVPVPRMLDLPVEDTHRLSPIHRVGRERQPDETPAAYVHRQYWGNYHYVPDAADDRSATGTAAACLFVEDLGDTNNEHACIGVTRAYLRLRLSL